jgi:hypothetical protein
MYCTYDFVCICILCILLARVVVVLDSTLPASKLLSRSSTLESMYVHTVWIL